MSHTLRMLLSMASSLLIHGTGIFAFGFIGTHFYHPASISWSEGASTVEVSIVDSGSFAPPPPTPPPSKPEPTKEAAPENIAHNQPAPKIAEEVAPARSQALAIHEPTPERTASKRDEENLSEDRSTQPARQRPSKSGAPVSNAGSPTQAEPTINFAPIPPYPEAARKSGREGIVTLRVRIDSRGSVSRIQLLQGSGYPEFDEAALKTVKNRWRFSPATCSGIPFESDKDIRVKFVLK